MIERFVCDEDLFPPIPEDRMGSVLSVVCSGGDRNEVVSVGFVTVWKVEKGGG